jgi:hypothetical protein
MPGKSRIGDGAGRRRVLVEPSVQKAVADFIQKPCMPGIVKSELVQNAAPMHDIGKISIPDSVLLKQGPSTRASGRSCGSTAR